MSVSFNTTEKIVLVLFGGILVPSLSFFAYRYARMSMRETDSIRSRLFLLYQLMYGALIGTCLGHLFTFWGNRFLAVGMIIGFVVVDLLDRINRYWWNDNLYMSYESIDESLGIDELGLDKGIIEDRPFASHYDIGTEEFAQNNIIVLKKKKAIQRKRLFFGILFVSTVFIITNNGIVLIISGAPSQLLVVCYYLNGLTLSICFCGGILHAQFFTDPERTRRRLFYAFLSVLFSLIFIISLIPLLAGVSASTAVGFLSHPAWIIVYGMCMGSYVYLFYYYKAIVYPDVRKKEQITGYIAFFIVLAQATVTGYFFN